MCTRTATNVRSSSIFVRYHTLLHVTVLVIFFPQQFEVLSFLHVLSYGAIMIESDSSPAILIIPRATIWLLATAFRSPLGSRSIRCAKSAISLRSLYCYLIPYLLQHRHHHHHHHHHYHSRSPGDGRRVVTS